MKWQGKVAASTESSRTSRRLSFQILTENQQEKYWSIYINWSVGMRRPWSQTLEEADMDTLRWRLRTRSKGHRQDLCLCRLTTQATAHKSWVTPKNKRSELKSYDKTKHCFENTPPWTEIWRIRLSQRWNQSSCPHWWISWHNLYKLRHSPCCNICSPDMGRLTRLTSRRTQSRWWVPKTPRNPLPDWLNSWKKKDNSSEYKVRQYPTPWWCPKGSPFWRRRRF